MKAKTRVYLDYAAATPLDPAVELAMQPYLSAGFGNPSSLYAEGRAAKLALEDARKRVAKVLGARSGEIVFTAGGTEAVNLAIQGVLRANPDGHILAAATEHQAVLASIEDYRHDLVPVKKNGKVQLDELERMINNETVLVCVTQINSELGTIQPISDVAALMTKVRAERKREGKDRPIYLFSDSSAAAGHISLQVSRNGVDLMVINGAKIYGPKQSGVLYIRSGTGIAPVIMGGGQERGLRSGTEAVAQAVGLATALELAEKERPKQEKRHYDLRKRVLVELSKIPGFVLNNPQHSLAGTINFRIEGASGEDLVYRLDAAGLAVATGAACSASHEQPSHVLLAIGLTKDQANSSLRISMGRDTTEAELQALASALQKLVQSKP